MMCVMKHLTERQEKILGFIVDRRGDAGVPPTVREIAAHFGYKSTNGVRQHLRLIEQKGHIRCLRGKARGIEVLVALEKQAKEDVVEVPMVGSIAAGTPIMAMENIEGTISLDRNLFKEQGRDLRLQKQQKNPSRKQ